MRDEGGQHRRGMHPYDHLLVDHYIGEGIIALGVGIFVSLIANGIHRAADDDVRPWHRRVPEACVLDLLGWAAIVWMLWCIAMVVKTILYTHHG